MCSDDDGRDALKEEVKEIKIINFSANHSASKWADFKNGLLTLNHTCTCNVDLFIGLDRLVKD